MNVTDWDQWCKDHHIKLLGKDKPEEPKKEEPKHA